MYFFSLLSSFIQVKQKVNDLKVSLNPLQLLLDQNDITSRAGYSSVSLCGIL